MRNKKEGKIRMGAGKTGEMEKSCFLS